MQTFRRGNLRDRTETNKLLDRRKSYPSWAGFAVLVALGAGSILSISGQAQTASRTGEAIFEKRCGGCHALDRDKEGPSLGGVYGREVSGHYLRLFPGPTKLHWSDLPFPTERA